MAEILTKIASIVNGRRGKLVTTSRDGQYFAVPYLTAPYLEVYRKVEGDYFKKLNVAFETNNIVGYKVASFSPTGRYLAVGFYTSANSTATVRMYSINNDTLTTIGNIAVRDTTGTGGTSQISWSEDENLLFIAQNNRNQGRNSLVYTFNKSLNIFTEVYAGKGSDTNNNFVLNNTDSSIVIEGGTLYDPTAYAREGNNLTLIEKLPNWPGTANTHDAAWSPNNKLIAFAFNSAPFLAMYKLEGGIFSRVATNISLPGSGWGVSWSRDGKTLFARPFNVNSGQVIMYDVNPDTGDSTLIGNVVDSPGTSPSGDTFQQAVRVSDIISENYIKYKGSTSGSSPTYNGNVNASFTFSFPNTAEIGNFAILALQTRKLADFPKPNDPEFTLSKPNGWKLFHISNLQVMQNSDPLWGIYLTRGMRQLTAYYIKKIESQQDIDDLQNITVSTPFNGTPDLSANDPRINQYIMYNAILLESNAKTIVIEESNETNLDTYGTDINPYVNMNMPVTNVNKYGRFGLSFLIASGRTLNYNSLSNFGYFGGRWGLRGGSAQLVHLTKQYDKIGIGGEEAKFTFTNTTGSSPICKIVTFVLAPGVDKVPSPTYKYMSVGTSLGNEVYKITNNSESITRITNIAANLSSQPTNNCKFGRNGQYLVTGHSTSPFLRAFRRTGDTFTELTITNAPTVNVNQISFSPSGDYFAVGLVGTTLRYMIFRINYQTGVITQVGSFTDAGNASVTAIGWSNDGNWLFIGRDLTTTNIEVHQLSYTNNGNTITPTVRQQYLIDNRSVYSIAPNPIDDTVVLVQTRTPSTPFTSTLRRMTFNKTTGALTSGAIVLTKDASSYKCGLWNNNGLQYVSSMGSAGVQPLVYSFIYNNIDNSITNRNFNLTGFDVLMNSGKITSDNYFYGVSNTASNNVFVGNFNLNTPSFVKTLNTVNATTSGVALIDVTDTIV